MPIDHSTSDKWITTLIETISTLQQTAILIQDYEYSKLVLKNPIADTFLAIGDYVLAIFPDCC